MQLRRAVSVLLGGAEEVFLVIKVSDTTPGTSDAMPAGHTRSLSTCLLDRGSK